MKGRDFFPWPVVLFGGVLSLFLFWAKFDGPDFNQYEQWADAFRAGDVTCISSDVASPLGVPLSQWSFGPGLIFALASKKPGTPLTLSPSLVVGWMAALILWISLAQLLWHATKNAQLTLLGLGIGAIGTMLGFYSNAVASETLSCAFLALMAFWVVCRKSWNAYDSLMVGILASFLAITRPQLSVYVPPLFLVLVQRWGKPPTRRSRVFVHGLFLALPLVIGFLQIMITNRWMTGSPLRSPYVFGDGVFQSVDLSNPEMAALLFHPWHGLFVYHPFYVLVLAALVLMILEKRPLMERLVYLSFLLAFAIHVYLQASWYVWWLGTWTFGMRGLAVSAVIFLPLFMKFLVERRARNRPIFIWVLGMLLATLWSYLLLTQHVTQFYTYAQVVRAQFMSFLHFLSLPRVYWSLILAGIITFFLFRKSGETQYRWASIMSIFVWIPALLWLYELALPRSTVLQKIPSSIRHGMMIFLTLLIPLLVKSIRQKADISTKCVSRATRISLIGIRALVIGSFIGTSILFCILAGSTENIIDHRHDDPLPMRYQSTIRIDEVEASLSEYYRVRGFDDKKNALKQFIERAKKEAESPRLPIKSREEQRSK